MRTVKVNTKCFIEVLEKLKIFEAMLVGALPNTFKKTGTDLSPQNLLYCPIGKTKCGLLCAFSSYYRIPNDEDPEAVEISLSLFF